MATRSALCLQMVLTPAAALAYLKRLIKVLD
jgi:hypothetical protein